MEVESPELPEHLALVGTVQGRRPAVGRFTAGLVVTFDADSVRRCEAALGAKDPTAGATPAKPVAANVDCALSARIQRPEGAQPCTVRNLSMGGLTIVAPVMLAVQESLDLMLDLPSGIQLHLTGQVIWCRADLSLAGLRITRIEPQAALLLGEALRSLCEESPTPGLGGVKVLIADDDPSILHFMERVVSHHGYRVLRAERGDTALELVRQEKPRLIFLDVLMPGLDGLAVCLAVRADVELARLPVVLLSAMGDARLSKVAEEVQASGYLSKPVRLAAVERVLTQYIGAPTPHRAA